MFFVSGDKLMDGDRSAAWECMLAELRLLENSDGDPILFHGTSSLRASLILADGFDPKTAWVPLPMPDGTLGGVNPCVFWTPKLEIAVARAVRHGGLSQGLPVILSARASDIAASGTPVPDYCMWEIDYQEDPARLPKDWMESLKMLGAIAVLDCRRVAGLRLHAVAPLDHRPSPAMHVAAIGKMMAHTIPVAA